MDHGNCICLFSLIGPLLLPLTGSKLLSQVEAVATGFAATINFPALLVKVMLGLMLFAGHIQNGTFIKHSLISTGLERLIKLIIISKYRVDIKAFPENKFLKGLGASGKTLDMLGSEVEGLELLEIA